MPLAFEWDRSLTCHWNPLIILHLCQWMEFQAECGCCCCARDRWPMKGALMCHIKHWSANQLCACHPSQLYANQLRITQVSVDICQCSGFFCSSWSLMGWVDALMTMKVRALILCDWKMIFRIQPELHRNLACQWLVRVPQFVNWKAQCMSYIHKYIYIYIKIYNI